MNCRREAEGIASKKANEHRVFEEWLAAEGSEEVDMKAEKS